MEIIKLFSNLKFALLGVGFAMFSEPFNWPPYFCLLLVIPLLDKSTQVSLSERLQIGLFFGLGYFLVLLKWLSIVGLDALFALSLICALWWATANAISVFFFGKRFWPFWFATSWTAIEVLRDRLPWGGFGWGQLGTIWINTPLSGLYSLVGQLGVTFFTYLALGTSFVLYLNRGELGRRQIVLRLLLTFSLTSVLSLASISFQPLSKDSSTSMNVVGVQGGVEHTGLGVLGSPRAVLGKHISLTKLNLPRVEKADLVVWPESSVDLDPFQDPVSLNQLMSLDNLISPPLLVGSTTHSNDSLKQNVSQVLQDQQLTTIYQKRHLVPFGEFLPLREMIEKYTDRAEMLSTDYEPGSKSGEIEISNIRLGILICFEIADDSLVFDNIENQSAVLVQTNNATYQHLGQTEQQITYTRIRAIETGRPVLSISTSGRSVVVDPAGNVTSSISQDDTGIIALEVFRISGSTFATKIHRFEILLLFLVFSCGLVFAILRRFKVRL